MGANNKKGFTLVELLVVVAIISLLSSVVLGAINDARSKARDRALVQQVKQIQSALELYRSKYQEYPDSSPGNLAQDFYTSHLSNTGTWSGLGSPFGGGTLGHRLIDRLSADGFLKEIKPQKNTLLYYSNFDGSNTDTNVRLKCSDDSKTLPKYIIGFIPENLSTLNSFPRILYTDNPLVDPYITNNYYQYNCIGIN